MIIIKTPARISCFFFFSFSLHISQDVVAMINGSIKYFVSARDCVSAVFSATCEVVVRPNGGRSLAGGSCKSVPNAVCCIWNGRVKTDVVGLFN